MQTRPITQAIRLALIPALVVAGTAGPALAVAPATGPSSLTLFHNNDGESKLLGSGGFGSAAHFATILKSERAAAAAAGRDTLTLSSGDNFLAGIALTASVSAGVYYDAIALAELGYDAITLGNHDFDFGPDFLATFISAYNAAGGTGTYLSANLDFTNEPALNALVGTGKIARSTVVTGGVSGERYGIIAVTTETLPTVSRPEGVTVGNVLTAIQAEVAALQAQVPPVNRIILSSHLQGLASELALIPSLSGVDVVIAGGGDEYLINPGTGGDRYSDTLDNVNDTPDDGFELRAGPYPVTSATDSTGKVVPVVTTIGEYRYVGKLEVEFDMNGEVSSVNGNPILVDPTAPGAVPDPSIVNNVNTPLIAAQNALYANVIGSTDVALNGRRGSITTPAGGVPKVSVAGVRNSETNEGNLVADAFRWQAQQTGEGLTGAPLIAFTNGGGIRNDNEIPAGSDLSQGTTIDILPFDNYVSIVNGVTAQALKEMLENAVSRWANGDGRFLQVAGFRFVWDPKKQATTFSTAARTMDDVAIEGDRVRLITLADGTVVYDASTGYYAAGSFDVVTNSFVASGGDGYDFAGNNDNDLPGTPSLGRTNLPLSYQQALFNYIQSPAGLAGEVTGAQYPAAGEGRILVAFDQDRDGDVDQNDVDTVLAGRNTSVPPGTYDHRDVNRDGAVNVLDARLTVLQCSRPRCAVN